MAESEKYVTLIFDEMTIEAKEKYVRNLDMHIGKVDMAGIVDVLDDGSWRTICYHFSCLGCPRA